MGFSLEFNALKEVVLGSKIEGTSEISYITGIASLKKAQRGDLSFLANPKYKSEVKDTDASLVLLPEDYSESSPKINQLFIKTKNPSRSLAEVCRLIYGKLFSNLPIGLDPLASVHQSAVIGDGVSVGPFCYIGKGVRVGKNTIIESHCYIGENVSLGEDCRLYPSVKVLANCEIGNGVHLNSGVVIGSEGYGFEQVGTSHEKIPHLGKVIIEDDVEIGANTCIDRGTVRPTLIGNGVKADNLAQIGHNVKIGDNSLICAQVGIAGSVVIGNNVVLGGQSGISDNIFVGDNVITGGATKVLSNIPAGRVMLGYPAMKMDTQLEVYRNLRKLPKLIKELAKIKKAVFKSTKID